MYASRGSWEALADSEELGFEVLELSLPPALTDDAHFARCKTWYQKNGRVVSVHGAFIDINPGSSDKLFRAMSRKRCRGSCALAKSLGAEYIIFHSSCEPFLRGSYLDAWAGQCASFFEELADEYGLNIRIENSQDLDAVPLQELMKRIRDPRIGVCLDLGHVNYSRMSAAQWFASLGEWIGYLHLSDNNGLFDEHLPLGEGTADWRAADALWRQGSRRMPITLEVGGEQGVRRSLQYLKEHGFFMSSGE